MSFNMINKDEQETIIKPILPLVDFKEKCYSCGEKATHVGLDGTYTCAKQVCMVPLLRRLRQEMN